MERKRLICSPADAEFTVAGAVFDRQCCRCGQKVMMAPSGQRLVAANEDVEITCFTCYLADEEDDAVELASSVEDVAGELSTIKPNLRRHRN